MKVFGGTITRGVSAIGLAMAGRRSPWGGGGGSEAGAGEAPSEPGAGENTGDETGGTAPGATAPGTTAPGTTGTGTTGPGTTGPGTTGPGTTGSSGSPVGKGPRNPWLPAGDPPPRRSASIEDIFRARDQRRKRPAGGGGNLPRLPQLPGGRAAFPLIVGAIVLIWLAVSTTHMIGPKQQGVVTTFGKYSHTIDPGVSLTFPWPIQRVSVTDVTSIKRDTIPEGEGEKLMLTSDQNLVDLSYLVRWNIKDLKLFSYQLADPSQTVREVAEAAMRASVSDVPLNAAMGGAGRAGIEQQVRVRMQAVLDSYRSGVQIQGVEIKKADPPTKTISAFQQVTAAQQDAQRDLSNAQAWAQQLTARAQGDAAAFDKVYVQYKLAPEVTRRRMYYETMERVLANNDKVIVEANGVTPYLPLPQITRRPPAAAGSASADAAPSVGGAGK